MRRKLVVFADGTGNAFRTQESNVWRLYQSLDQSRPDQIARYIRGVGTAGFRPFAMLDGATGIGVPSNVRELYRFLCWNWRPEDEIWMFGFSRGAFTIRTLIGLIDSQGLVPTEIDGVPVSHAEMVRNTNSAWRAYRNASALAGWGRPTIAGARLLRDAVLGMRRRRSRYATARAAMPAERKRVRIRFAGLFDTVEAYGVPIEELRVAIDKVIWPISFRNHQLCPNVELARHALSLDDERTTFHPLRFDMTAGGDRIKEVWFAGVHSDVGGGYPEDALAHVPLLWMAEEADRAGSQGPGDGLRFCPGALNSFRERASAFGPRHDSRAGAAVMYRYAPRPMPAGAANGGLPVVHHSVAERMVFGSGNYAPVTLPSAASVLMPDGRTLPLKGFGERLSPAERTQLAQDMRQGKATPLVALRRLSRPRSDIVALTRDYVWLRRVTYFALLGAVLMAASLPLTAPTLGDASAWLFRWTAAQLGGERFADWVRALTDGFAINLDAWRRTLGGLLPDAMAPYVDVATRHWVVSSAALGVAFAFYGANGRLRDRIAEHARSAWLPESRAGSKRRGSTAGGEARTSPLLRAVRRLRGSRVLGALHHLGARYLLPGLAVLVLGLALLMSVSRFTVSHRAGAGKLCPEVTDSPELVPATGAVTREGFRTDHICWPSGIRLEQGRRYTLWIEVTKPFKDDHMPSGAGGFSRGSWAHRAGLPLRRWWSARWFQPVARINPGGGAQWPLQSLDGAELHEAVPSEPAAAADLLFVAEFIAPASGELFLYLNDAIAALPLLPTVTWFYTNNRGTARVTLQRTPLPTPR